MKTKMKMMTVGKLINLLSEYPKSMRVVVDGYEYAYDDPFLRQIDLVLNYEEKNVINGVHYDSFHLRKADKEKVQSGELKFIACLCISRKKTLNG